MFDVLSVLPNPLNYDRSKVSQFTKASVGGQLKSTQIKLGDRPATSDLLLAEYHTLRSEIQESIKHQHQILLSGYAAALATIGAKADAYPIAPFVLFVMAALWSTECNRMVRAGYYIAYHLWPELCVEYRGKANWEDWVRLETKHPFRGAQDVLQQVVVYYVIQEHYRHGFLEANSLWVLVGLYLLLLIFWIVLWRIVRRVSNLGGIEPEGSPPPHY